MTSGRKDFPLHFSDTVGKHLERSVPLRDHSHFQIGGNADYFFHPASEAEFVQAVRLAKQLHFPFYVIGGGYNIIFDDEGFRGLIIKNSVKGINLRHKTEVNVFSGMSLRDMLQFCMDKKLGNLEFLAGIPGTVGGAVFGNAGAFNQDIGSFLKEAFLLGKNGEEFRVDKEYFAFGYRESQLKRKHDVLLRSVFEVGETNRAKIMNRIDEYLRDRKKKHPPREVACAGSYFKNPVLSSGEKVAAAYLLDQVGAKELREGGAAVYDVHANFIINEGQASAQDVLRLASELKRRVKEKFGVDLEEEVIFLPEGFSLH